MGDTKNLFRPKEYFRPSSIVEAIELLKKYGEQARLVAGGTDVLVEKDSRIKIIIDTAGLGLAYIKNDGEGIRIGAATTFANIEASPILDNNPYNILAQAAHQMGTPQIRNVATIGGNICSAVPSADSAPPLLALDASVVIAGPGGERSIDIADFFIDVRRNAMEKSELLTEIRLPILPSRTAAAFIKKGRVAAGDLALVSVAVRLTMNANRTWQSARIALGAVAPTPLRARKAEAILLENKPQDGLLNRVADHALLEIKPISDIRSSAEYRMILSRVLVERALRDVTARLLS
jgi:carbon-monoxide dehydrogenase medium subunit